MPVGRDDADAAVETLELPPEAGDQEQDEIRLGLVPQAARLVGHLGPRHVDEEIRREVRVRPGRRLSIPTGQG